MWLWGHQIIPQICIWVSNRERRVGKGAMSNCPTLYPEPCYSLDTTLPGKVHAVKTWPSGANPWEVSKSQGLWSTLWINPLMDCWTILAVSIIFSLPLLSLGCSGVSKFLKNGANQLCYNLWNYELQPSLPPSLPPSSCLLQVLFSPDSDDKVTNTSLRIHALRVLVSQEESPPTLIRNVTETAVMLCRTRAVSLGHIPTQNMEQHRRSSENVKLLKWHKKCDSSMWNKTLLRTSNS